MNNKFSRINICLKPFLNGFSIFLGILFLGLMSCSIVSEYTSSSPTKDNIPPTATISTDKSLKKDETATITFTFSEEVTNFTPSDVKFSIGDFSVNDITISNFITNNPREYSLDITPKVAGTLTISIPTNSFYDLSSNKNANSFSTNFSVEDNIPPTHTISFKLNGGSFKDPQITNLKVVSNTAIEETQLGGILSYPPTGPQSNIQAVTRDIFEWRTNGTKYDFSTPVSNDLTLEAVWSNSCGKVETFHPTNKNELKDYTDAAVADSTTNLNHIDTSAITDMVYLFYEKTNFNGEIDCWNTAKVTDMSSVFWSATAFNQDIGSWNTANVTTMSNMFLNANAFNQNIGSWNVANVTNMNDMFYNASAFNQNIGSWNVANVTNMRKMFNRATEFNGDVSNWNVANVTDMRKMFSTASNFNQDISDWNVANVTNMSSMFRNAIAFNRDISRWDVANVTDMEAMFNGASAFNQDISSWDVANVNNMSSMFNNAWNFNQDISNWNVANVTNMGAMFNEARAFNKDIRSWNVANVNNMYAMFNSANAFNQDIGSWNVANVNDMNRMFYRASAFNQNLSSWSVSNVDNHTDMFTSSAMATNASQHPKFP